SAEGGGQVRVVGTSSVGPREMAIGSTDRTERHRWIPERHELVFVVPGQRMDGADGALAAGGWIGAVRGGPPGVGGLRPGMAVVEGEIVARDADAGGTVEAGPVVDRQVPGASLRVDEVVGPSQEDIRGVGVHCHRRLVLV